MSMGETVDVGFHNFNNTNTIIRNIQDVTAQWMQIQFQYSPSLQYYIYREELKQELNSEVQFPKPFPNLVS